MVCCGELSCAVDLVHRSLRHHLILASNDVRLHKGVGRLTLLG